MTAACHRHFTSSGGVTGGLPIRGLIRLSRGGREAPTLIFEFPFCSFLDSIVRNGDGMFMTRYPGGKGRCYQRIISLMPPHVVYIETHLGGGAVLRHKRPAERSIGIDIDDRVIDRWRSAVATDCSLVQGDAVAFLRTYAFEGGELVYADPPYLPETRRKQKIYRHEYSRDQHVELLDALASLNAAVMISGYRSDLYDERLRHWRRVDFMGDSHAGPRLEVHLAQL